MEQELTRQASEEGISIQLEERLLVEREKLKMQIRQQVQREYQDLIKTLQDKLKEQSQQVLELRQAQSEIERLTKERDDRNYAGKENKEYIAELFPPAPRSLHSGRRGS